MTGVLVQIVRCVSCGRNVGGADDVGRCPGCRGRALLTDGQIGVLAAMRRIVLSRGRRNLTVWDIATAAGHYSTNTTHHHLKVLRRHGFVDWVDGSDATIHLTRGLGCG